MPIAPSSDGNTRLTLPTWGEVELKYVSGGDSMEYAKILAVSNDSKTTVQKVLFNQLITPKVTWEQFQELPDDELRTLASAFASTETSLFAKIPDKDSQDFYGKLVDQLAVSQRDATLGIQKALAAASNTGIQQALDGFAKKYDGIIGEVGQNALASVANIKIPASIFKVPTPILPNIAPLLEQAKLTQKIFESLQPQLDFVSKWAEQQKNLFSGITSAFTKAAAEYKIAEPVAAKLLLKYKWFISPHTPAHIIFRISELDKKPGRQDSAVNALFVGYFEADNWATAEAMATEWENSPYLKTRYKIIMDCIQTMRAGSRAGINVANSVLPTLIVQIDGILNDYMRDKGLTAPASTYGQRNAAIRSTPLPILNGKWKDLTNELFLNVLFQSAWTGQPLANPFNFNRHKILHAENTHYGRKVYLVRAIMVLDALASLR